MAPARRHLSLNALRAFEAAARHRHMARAARELGVTHGAVSRHIRLLEQDLAVALFDRRHNRIRLTAEGARLFPVVREALDRVTTAALGLGGGPPAGRLTVACTPTLATSFLIPALDGFRSRYPALDQARVSHRDGGGTVQRSRQTRRGAQRDVDASGKRLDAGCRLLCTAPHTVQSGVAPGRPPASSEPSTVGACYAFRASPRRSTRPGAMTPPSL